nr:ribonuclease H-like domain-containing protein [Tanacetum cinerariifolium]
MAFLSSSGGTNEVDTTNIQVSTVSTPVSTVITHDNTANLSDATVYAFLANQPNRSQLVHEDIEQIHRVDLEEIDLKWQLALLGMRARRYFQRTGKKITINGSDTAGYDKTKVLIRATWLMLKLQPTWLLWLSQTQRDSSFKDSKINALNLQMERLRKEKESNQIKIDNFENASKSLVKWIESQISDNSRKVLRFASYNAFAPPPIGLFAPPTIDLSNSGLEEFQHPKFKGYGPKATVLTKSGIVPISTARQNSSRAVSPVSVARPINTDAPKPLVNVAKPRQNALHK